MPELHERIRHMVRANRYVVGEHAVERLAERGILEWQVVAGLDDGRLRVERPQAAPHPAIEVHQLLADGTSIKAVWSYLATLEAAKLVTVHYMD